MKMYGTCFRMQIAIPKVQQQMKNICWPAFLASNLFNQSVANTFGQHFWPTMCATNLSAQICCTEWFARNAGQQVCAICWCTDWTNVCAVCPFPPPSQRRCGERCTEIQGMQQLTYLPIPPSPFSVAYRVSCTPHNRRHGLHRPPHGLANGPERRQHLRQVC